MQSGVVFNSGISCVNLPNARLTGMRHYSLVVGGLLVWNRCSFYFSPLLQENLPQASISVMSINLLTSQGYLNPFTTLGSNVTDAPGWCSSIVHWWIRVPEKALQPPCYFFSIWIRQHHCLTILWCVCEETCRMCSQAPWTNDQYRIRHDSIWFPLFLFHWRLICLGASLSSAPARPPTGVLWT